DDAADATVAALDRGAAGAAYNIADDEPVSLSDLMIAIAEAIGAPRPMVVPTWVLTAMPYAKAVMTGGLRVSNAKARDELGWTPNHPTYREGVAEFAEHYRRQAAA
ncbi:MAG TPA: NAD(P)-dependent oxidoreductase, partial [Microlunatus sp.]